MNLKTNYELKKESFANYEDLALTYIFFEKEDINNIEIKFETFREVEFRRCRLNNVTFSDTFLGKVKFQNCELNNVTFTGSSLSKVVFDNCKLISASFFEANLNDVNIIESLIEYSKIENSKHNKS